MAILSSHIPYYREIFRVPGVMKDPFCMMGFQSIVQDMDEQPLPKDFDFPSVKHLLASRGLQDILTVDLFDGRADLKWDFNCPVPGAFHEKYNALLDIGTMEHVFDTKQYLENSLRMVKVGGVYVLHTPVNGYFKHGLHVFNPDGLLDALRLNRFEIIYHKYSTESGLLVENLPMQGNIIMWVVARKLKKLETFVVPQQQMWVDVYKQPMFSAEMELPKPPDGLDKYLIKPLKEILYRFLSQLWKMVIAAKSWIKKKLEG